MSISTKEMYGHPLFEGIKEENFAAMLNCLGAYVKSFKKNEIIFLSEEPVKSVGIVLKGTIRMLKEYENGDSTILIDIEKGELLGETFACGSSLNSRVTFQSAVDSQMLFVPFYKVLHTCNMTCGFHHRLIENMVRLISNKNIALMEKVEAISRKTLRDKIMTYLLNQTDKQGKSEFEIPLGRIALSEYLCTDRSSLTRELTNMQKEGMLSFQKNRFKINK